VVELRFVVSSELKLSNCGRAFVGTIALCSTTLAELNTDFRIAGRMSAKLGSLTAAAAIARIAGMSSTCR
jgi:hypothetical protein